MLLFGLVMLCTDTQLQKFFLAKPVSFIIFQQTLFYNDNAIFTCINSGGATKYQNLHCFQRYAFANEKNLIFITLLPFMVVFRVTN